MLNEIITAEKTLDRYEETGKTNDLLAAIANAAIAIAKQLERIADDNESEARRQELKSIWENS